MLGKRTAGSGNGDQQDEWYIESIRITYAGTGYALQERPLTTVTGIGSANVEAVGPTNMRNLSAQTGVAIEAGDFVTLLNTVTTATGNVAIEAREGVTIASSVNAHVGSIVLVSQGGAATVQQLMAGTDVVAEVSGTFTLLGVVDADGGDITIVSRNRDLDFSSAGAELHAMSGGITLAAYNGAILSSPTLNAWEDVSITSLNTVVLNNEITSFTGDIVVRSTSSGINLNSNVVAHEGSVRLNAQGVIAQTGGGIGYVTVVTPGSGYRLTSTTVRIAPPSSGRGVAATARPVIDAAGRITGILLLTPGSGYGAGERPEVTITGTGATAGAGATALAVAAPALGDSGLAAADVLAGGSGYTATTTVTIAAPAGGGRSATARAIIDTVDGVAGVIVGIVIDDPGSGYGAGETPVVTIEGAGTGATAVAIAAITLQDIRAGMDIEIEGRSGVRLLNIVQARDGDVSISAPAGNVNLSARTSIVSSLGGNVAIEARRGSVSLQRIAAQGDIDVSAQLGITVLNAINSAAGDVALSSTNGDISFVAPNGRIVTQTGGVSLSTFAGAIRGLPSLQVGGDIELRSAAPLTVSGNLNSGTGSITLASTTGSLTLGTTATTGNLFAADRVTLQARTGVTQAFGTIQAPELVVTNTTATPVSLTSPTNNVGNFAASNPAGAVTFVEADGFETGVLRGGPLGVEVSAQTLNLSSIGPKAVVRVVSGLAYRTLTVAGGTGGTVDFVTTSSGDNPVVNAAFAGTLRDMIRYVNDNSAVVAENGGTVSTPMDFAFDETGYAVTEIAVGAELPAIARRATFDGNRLEEGVLGGSPDLRLGIRGTAGIRTGLSLGVDTARKTSSSGSTLKNVAAYGFTTGSAFHLGSGSNTITEIYAGDSRVGLEIQGATATSNEVGRAAFDKDRLGDIDRTSIDVRANVFEANEVAGVLIRGGAAGNRVQGSFIVANGDGVRITNAARNTIGNPDALQYGLFPSVSNVIAGNSNSGIHLIAAAGGTLTNANRIRNNRIEANLGSNKPNTGYAGGAGITVRDSSWVVIGGLSDQAGNQIVGQQNAPGSSTHGIHVVNSSDVRIVRNGIGVELDPTSDRRAFGGNGEYGNEGDGIRIEQSRSIEISGGNVIGGNVGDGIHVRNNSTGVGITDTLVGLIDDGTPEGIAVGNGRDGIAILASVGNTVGAGNRIAYNAASGVSVTDARATSLATGNRVVSAEIFRNYGAGIRIFGGSSTTVGGSAAGSGNIIYRNAGDGIGLDWSDWSKSPTGHLIQGNFVGTGRNALADAGLDLGNRGSGIRISAGTNNVVSHGNMVMNNQGNGVSIVGGTGNVVGGETAVQGNVISDNGLNGVRVVGGAALPRTATTVMPARNNTIMGNVISDNGVLEIPGRGNGVHVVGPNGTGGPIVAGITVGQRVTATAVTGLGNTIERNFEWGVNVVSEAQQVSVCGNSIADNGGGALNVQPGANRSAPGAAANWTYTLQQPVSGGPRTAAVSSPLHLEKAVMRRPSGSGQLLEIYGGLMHAAVPQQQYSIEIYANSPSDGPAQLRRFLGRATVTANSAGLATFTLRITAPIEVGEVITATATSLRFEAGSTSMAQIAVTADLPLIR